MVWSGFVINNKHGLGVDYEIYYYYSVFDFITIYSFILDVP